MRNGIVYCFVMSEQVQYQLSKMFSQITEIKEEHIYQ